LVQTSGTRIPPLRTKTSSPVGRAVICLPALLNASTKRTLSLERIKYQSLPIIAIGAVLQGFYRAPFVGKAGKAIYGPPVTKLRIGNVRIAFFDHSRGLCSFVSGER
jgi:hypothetical protein